MEKSSEKFGLVEFYSKFLPQEADLRFEFENAETSVRIKGEGDINLSLIPYIVLI